MIDAAAINTFKARATEFGLTLWARIQFKSGALLDSIVAAYENADHEGWQLRMIELSVTRSSKPCSGRIGSLSELLLLLFIGAVICIGGRSVSAATGLIQKDDVLLSIGNIDFLLSRKYMPFAKNIKDGKLAEAVIVAYLPNLDPEGPTNLHLQTEPEQYAKNTYIILVSTDSNNVAKSISSINDFTNHCETDDGISRNDGLQMVPCWGSASETYWVYVSMHKAIALMRCMRDGAALFPSCQVRFDYDANLVLQVTFDANRRNDVMDVRDQTSNLFDRFNKAAREYSAQ